MNTFEKWNMSIPHYHMLMIVLYHMLTMVWGVLPARQTGNASTVGNVRYLRGKKSWSYVNAMSWKLSWPRLPACVNRIASKNCRQRHMTVYIWYVNSEAQGRQVTTIKWSHTTLKFSFTTQSCAESTAMEISASPRGEFFKTPPGGKKIIYNPHISRPLV